MPCLLSIIDNITIDSNILQVGIYCFNITSLQRMFGAKRPLSLAEKLSGAELNRCIQMGSKVSGIIYPSSIQRLKLDTQDDLTILQKVLAKWPAFPKVPYPDLTKLI